MKALWNRGKYSYFLSASGGEVRERGHFASVLRPPSSAALRLQPSVLGPHPQPLTKSNLLKVSKRCVFLMNSKTAKEPVSGSLITQSDSDGTVFDQGPRDSVLTNTSALHHFSYRPRDWVSTISTIFRDLLLRTHFAYQTADILHTLMVIIPARLWRSTATSRLS
jgi:hypothetical protein